MLVGEFACLHIHRETKREREGEGDGEREGEGERFFNPQKLAKCF